jgi:hypothetical protein
LKRRHQKPGEDRKMIDQNGAVVVQIRTERDQIRIELKIVRFEVSTAVTMMIIISQKMIIIELKIDCQLL